ncbi:hypothetical protein D3C78_1703060 [compost metagenome]
MTTISLRLGATWAGISLDLKVELSSEAFESVGAASVTELSPSDTQFGLSDLDLTRLCQRMPELLVEGLEVQQRNLAFETQRILHERLKELERGSGKEQGEQHEHRS